MPSYGASTDALISAYFLQKEQHPDNPSLEVLRLQILKRGGPDVNVPPAPFSDNFAGDLSQWDVTKGSWSIVGGEAQCVFVPGDTVLKGGTNIVNTLRSKRTDFSNVEATWKSKIVTYEKSATTQLRHRIVSLIRCNDYSASLAGDLPTFPSDFSGLIATLSFNISPNGAFYVGIAISAFDATGKNVGGNNLVDTQFGSSAQSDLDGATFDHSFQWSGLTVVYTVTAHYPSAISADPVVLGPVSALLSKDLPSGRFALGEVAYANNAGVGMTHTFDTVLVTPQ